MYVTMKKMFLSTRFVVFPVVMSTSAPGIFVSLRKNPEAIVGINHFEKLLGATDHNTLKVPNYSITDSLIL